MGGGYIGVRISVPARQEATLVAAKLELGSRQILVRQDENRDWG